MGALFYLLGLLMAILWGVAFFGFQNYGIVHLLLLISLIATVYGFLLQRRNYD